MRLTGKKRVKKTKPGERWSKGGRRGRIKRYQLSRKNGEQGESAKNELVGPK